MTRVVQLTDTHICEPSELLYGKVDTAQHLREAVDAINQLDPMPDIVLITGDLVDRATATSYANFQDCIAPLKIPVRLLPGNHDKPSMMVDVFHSTELFPVTSYPYQYGFDCDDIHIIMANTHKDGSGLPEFRADRLNDLEARIQAADKPILLALHHPPFTTDMSFIDIAGSEWFEGLRQLMNSYERVKQIICGHGHSELTGRLGNIPVFMSGSQAHQLYGERGVDVAPRFITSPAPPIMYCWREGAGFEVAPHEMPADDGGSPVDILAGMDWVDLKEQMKNDGD